MVLAPDFRLPQVRAFCAAKQSLVIPSCCHGQVFCHILSDVHDVWLTRLTWAQPSVFPGSRYLSLGVTNILFQ